jgi:hypothetical protein
MSSGEVEFMSEGVQAVVDLCASCERADVASSMMLLGSRSREELLAILAAVPPVVLALAYQLADDDEETMAPVYEVAADLKRVFGG